MERGTMALVQMGKPKAWISSVSPIAPSTTAPTPPSVGRGQPSVPPEGGLGIATGIDDDEITRSCHLQGVQTTYQVARVLFGGEGHAHDLTLLSITPARSMESATTQEGLYILSSSRNPSTTSGSGLLSKALTIRLTFAPQPSLAPLMAATNWRAVSVNSAKFPSAMALFFTRLPPTATATAPALMKSAVFSKETPPTGMSFT